MTAAAAPLRHTQPLVQRSTHQAQHLTIFYPNLIIISTHNRTASKRRTSRVDAHPLGPEHQAVRFATANTVTLLGPRWVWTATV
ncbi:unnamed protein product [Prunus armeniaca]